MIERKATMRGWDSRKDFIAWANELGYFPMLDLIPEIHVLRRHLDKLMEGTDGWRGIESIHRHAELAMRWIMPRHKPGMDRRQLREISLEGFLLISWMLLEETEHVVPPAWLKHRPAYVME
ncbi:MAG: hypothetical protein ABSG31_18305 [Tepidisphaeraceae bacterium]|jgi:hypothetical protein